MNLNYRKLENTIVGTIDGKPFNIAKTKENLNILESAAPDANGIAFLVWTKSQRQQEIAGSNEYLLYNPLTKEYFLKYDGYRSKHAIPAALVKFIEESYDKDIDFMPIIKAWARLLGTNPRYNAKFGQLFGNYLNETWTDQDEVEKIVDELKCTYDQARGMATYQDIAITQEGLLATFKVADMVTWKYIMEWDPEAGEGGEYVKKRNHLYKPIAAEICPTTGEVFKEGSFEKPEFLEDYQFTPSICKNGDKFYSGPILGYVYKVGEIQKLPKDAIRNLNHSFGGGGLYTGGLKYIDGYHTEGENYVLCCLVDPGDILSFQDDGCALRTDALLPNSVRDMDLPFEGKGIYNSSDYDKLSKERLEFIMKNAVKHDINLVEEQETINYERGSGRVMKEDELAADTFPGPPPNSPPPPLTPAEDE